jgi:single-stranded-DNA-specific exonuclease
LKQFVAKISRRIPPANDCSSLHPHPIIARLFATRGIENARQMDTSLACLHPANLLGGIDRAVALLVDAIRRQRCIVIVGDYDADGATSTALAMRLLRAMGAQRVHYFVPDRFRYGYGLNPDVVDSVAKLDPDLLITVDNGIASVDGVAAARQRGFDVLVTDHHLPPQQLPDATAIVNPNLDNDAFPSKNLAGVGVIFYLLSALRTRLKDIGWFDEAGLEVPNTAHCLDLVALGTVADVVPLDGNNRILVEQGLRRIRAGKMCCGVAALLAVGGRDAARAVAADLAFAAGPRLNAAGRLEDMSLGIACLLAESDLEAREIAANLDNLNRERRTIEADMREQANVLLEEWLAANRDRQLPSGLCLYNPEWHEGVIGILAGRVRESVHRPAIIFTRGTDEKLKGSARSIPGVHIRDCIARVDSAIPGLVIKFGGHAMAAGLSLEESSLERFGEAFAESVELQLNGAEPDSVIYTDGELDKACFSLDFAEQLRFAAPWGQHFPEPLFEGIFRRTQQRIVGQHHLKMTVHPIGDTDTVIDAIAFNETGDELGNGDVHLVYKLDINEYRGNRRLQLLVENIADST